MDAVNAYYVAVKETLERIQAEETLKIKEAGRLIAESLAQDRLLHVLGTGAHSFIGAEEVFDRAGGLVQVDAMLDPGVSLIFGSARGSRVERTPGYAKAVLDSYPLQPGDVIIIVNANGINSLTIDAALEAKKRGLTVVAVTSPECSQGIPAGHPARHPSNRNLYEIADICLDSKTPTGEALVTIQGCDQKVAPASTITNAFILHSVIAAAVEHMVALGIEPKVWKSGNAPGGDEANERYSEEYITRIKHLR